MQYESKSCGGTPAEKLAHSSCESSIRDESDGDPGAGIVSPLGVGEWALRESDSDRPRSSCEDSRMVELDVAAGGADISRVNRVESVILEAVLVVDAIDSVPDDRGRYAWRFDRAERVEGGRGDEEGW